MAGEEQTCVLRISSLHDGAPLRSTICVIFNTPLVSDKH